MTAAFSGKAATEEYICAYVRGMLRGGFLHTTSRRGEGYIAYKLPGEKLGLKTVWPVAQGMLRNSSLKRLVGFGVAVKRGVISSRAAWIRRRSPISSWDLSACGKHIRDRAICERSWTSPLLRETVFMCR